MNCHKWFLAYHFQNNDTQWCVTGGMPSRYHLKACCSYFMENATLQSYITQPGHNKPFPLCLSYRIVRKIPRRPRRGRRVWKIRRHGFETSRARSALLSLPLLPYLRGFRSRRQYGGKQSSNTAWQRTMEGDKSECDATIPLRRSASHNWTYGRKPVWRCRHG